MRRRDGQAIVHRGYIVSTKWKSAVTVFVIAVFVGVRFAIRATECLDGDEIFSINIARLSWSQLWTEVALDVSHPPLFYILLKLWIAIGGESLAWLRLLPVLTGVALLVPLWGLCRELHLKQAEQNLTVAMMCLNGFVLFYSIQLRMYSLLLFASLCAIWAFARWLHSEKKDWWPTVWLIAADLLVVYSHYWGWVVVGCQGLFLLFSSPRSVLKFSAVVGMLVLSYVPWIIAVLHGAASKGSYTSQITWITRPGVSDVIWFYASLVGALPIRHATLPIIVLCGLPLLAWAWAAIRKHERSEAFWFLLLFALIPVLLTFAASFGPRQSIWAERALMGCVAPFLMLVAMAACRLRRGLANLVVLGLFALSTASGVYYLSRPHKLPWDTLTSQIAWAESDATEPVPVYSVECFITDPLQYFTAEQRTADRLRVAPINPKAIDQIREPHFWIVYREFGKKAWLVDRPPEEVLASKQCQIGKAIEIANEGMLVRAVPVRRTSIN